MSVVDMTKVIFTDHALKRFEERFTLKTRGIKSKGRGWLGDSETTARSFLARAREDDSLDSVAKVKRLIDNNFEEVKYFADSGWRFVIKDDGTNLIVLTIEFQTS